MATLALQGGGAAVGSAFGGPAGAQVGSLLGGLAASYLVRPKPEETFGPRLGDDVVTDATEGVDVPRSWGDDRLAGQLIWQGPRIDLENEEDIGGKGGPTATHTTYTYRRSFAVDFGAYASQAILRLWLNKELVYDRRPAAVGIRKAGLSFTTYFGSETQEPDPVIESYVGAGNVSAHRGHTYIVFDNYDVTNIGGRPPTVEAEILTDATQASPSVTVDCNTQANDLGVIHWDSFNKLIFAYMNGGLPAGSDDAICAVIDPFSRTLVKLIDRPSSAITGIPFTTVESIELGGRFNDRLLVRGRNLFAVYDTQNFDQLSNFDQGTLPLTWVVEVRNNLAMNDNAVFKIWPKTGETLYSQTLPTGYTNEEQQWGNASNTWLIKVMRKTATGEYAAVRYHPSTITPSWGTIHDWGKAEADWLLFGFVYDSINDHLWCSARDTVGSENFLFKVDLEGDLVSEISLGDIGTWAVSGQYPIFFDASTKSLYLHQGTTIYIFDVVNETLDSKTITHGSGWSVYIPELDEIWCGDPDNSNRAEVYGDAISRSTSNKIDDADIITDICALAGIPAASLDVTQVTTQRVGYRHSRRVSARSDLEPLLIAAHLDVVQSDYKLKFVPRGGAVVATIDADLLGAHVQGSSPPVAIQQRYAQGVDYPSSMDVSYRSVEADLQPGLASSAWYANDYAEHKETLTLPMSMEDAEAVDLAESYLQMIVEKDRFTWSTPRYYAHLEPTDPVNLTVNGETVRVRITKVERGADGIHTWNGELDDPSDLTSYGVAGGGGVESAEVDIFSTPQLLIVDGPLLRDIDNDHPGPYLAGFTRGPGYPGAVVYMSSDGATYLQSTTLGSEVFIGQVELSAIPKHVVLDGWDDTNTITVTMINGTLSSKTEAEVLAGANAMLWGVPGRWEVIQPATCTFVSGTTWDLTHILRGRRGTDWAMDTHQTTGDWLIVADQNTLARLVLSNSEIGAQRWFKTPAFGIPVVDANAQLITVGNQPLLPYSAIEADSTFDASSSTISWLRRTRKGGFYGGAGSLVDGVGGSISEDVESWEVDISLAATPDTVARTLTASAASVVYSNTNKATDGVPNDGPFRAAIYQLSAAVGRGHVREAYLAKTFYDAIEGGGPRAYFEFDETSGTTATDEMGNHNGTISGSVTLNKTGLAGLGTCFGFGAVGDKVQTAADAALKLGNAWTIMFWLKPTAGGTVRQVFKIRSTVDLWLIQLMTTNQIEIFFRDTGGTLLGPWRAPAFTAGNTYAIALTYDGTTFRYYIDGVQENFSVLTQGTSPTTGNPTLTVGDSACGDVDEVAVYKRHMDIVEIEGILALA